MTEFRQRIAENLARKRREAEEEIQKKPLASEQRKLKVRRKAK